MNNKFPKKGHAEKHDADDFQAERNAASKKFTDADKKEFWKNFDKDYGTSGKRNASGEENSSKKDNKFSDRKARPDANKSKGFERSYDRKGKGERTERGERKPYSDRPKNAEGTTRSNENKSFGDKRKFDSERSDRKFQNDRPKSYEGGARNRDAKPYGDKSRKFDVERSERKSFNDRPKNLEGRHDRDSKPYGDKPRKFDGERSERKSFHDRPKNYEGGRDSNSKSYGDKPRKFDGERKERSSFNDRPKRYESGDRKEGKSFDRKPSRKFEGDEQKPQRKTFQDVMNNAYNQRFDKGDSKKEPREERAPIEFESVELKNRFETKFDKKESFERSERKDFKEKRGDRPAPKEDKKSSARAAFLEHFDYENPNERVYDAKGNKGVRTEQQEYGNLEIMPLNKYIAHCGVCSRRDAVELIKNGKITINGKVASEPGYKVLPEDIVQLEGKPLKVQKNLVYVLLNKPKGFITTTDDPKGRRTVMDIFGDNIKERMFPVGRLDRNTTGLLLLTNDGEMAQQLSHPKYENRKIYQVTLDRNVSKNDFEKIINGLDLEDGTTQVDQLEYLDKKNEIGIEIHSGKNRIVRRIFEHLGYEVEKLDRVMYAGLTKKNLKRGQWRFLTKQEIINLKHLRK